MRERLVVVVVPAGIVAAVAWASGGYFPRSWGALLLLPAVGLATAALLAAAVDVARPALLLTGALAALALWEAVSRAWAVAPDGAILEAERTLVYAAVAAAAVVAVARRLLGDLVLGVLAGTTIVTVAGLLEHVLGSGGPGGRLEAPVGYANAAGMLAATTLLLAVGLALDGSATLRAACAAPLPLAAVALYLSLSRGAMLATAVGLIVLAPAIRSAVSLGRIVLIGVPVALAVAVAAVGRLDRSGVAVAELVTLAAVGCLSVAAASAAVWSPSLRVPALPRRIHARVLWALAVLALAGVIVAGAHEIRDVRSSPAAQQGAPDRLLSTSTSYRADYWDVAAAMVEDDPLLGAGAGGFERTWLRERPALLYVRDAHNLYLETLAELGPVGLALLLLALLAPLLTARRAMHDPTARAALAAYVALLAHAGLDWDWELPVVTLCSVLLGVAVAGSGDTITRPLTGPGRSALLATAVALGAVALVVHVGNGATAEAHEALDRGDARAATTFAERARRFMPWAAEPWQLLGEAELAGGRLVAGRDHIRRATREDPGSRSAWLALAIASTGREKRLALRHARSLDPLAPEIDVIEAGDP